MLNTISFAALSAALSPADSARGGATRTGRKPRGAKPTSAPQNAPTSAASGSAAPAPASGANVPLAALTAAERSKLATAEIAAATALQRAFDAGRVSVPIKSENSNSKYIPALAQSRCANPSIRQAAALAVACLAAGKTISDGAVFNRRFKLSNGAFFIENGCNADCVNVGLTDYNPTSGDITLRSGAAETIESLITAAAIKNGLPDIAEQIAAAMPVATVEKPKS